MKLHLKLILFFTLSVLGIMAVYPLDPMVHDWMDAIRSPVLTFFFQGISFPMLLIFVLLIMTSLFMWEERKKEWILPTWFSFLASLGLSFLLKFIVGRDRPLLDQFIFGFPDYSFPSTHAAICFAVVPILDKEFPTLKWFWISFAMLVSVSRVYLKVHFLTDVLAGALLGLAVGLGVLYLKDRHSVLR
jgi:membrane-associated phospholipid phosphatase